MALKHFRKRINKTDFDTAIEFMYAKNPTISKLMKRLELRAQVTPEESITGEELEKLSVSNTKKINKMAATAKKSNTNLYLTPYDGALRKWVKEATETSKQRTKATGDVVNEELFSSAIGKIKRIYNFDQPINGKDVKFLVIYLHEDNEKDPTVIQTPFKVSIAQSFLMRLGNIDLTKTVELRPYTIENKEKSKEKGKPVFNDYLIPYQGTDEKGKAIKIDAYWSKDNTGELPQIKIIKDKKGVISSVITVERDEFLEEYVINVNEKIQKISQENVETKNVASPELQASLADDDIPF